MLQLEMVSYDFICNHFTVQDDTTPVQIISDCFQGVQPPQAPGLRQLL